MDFAAHQKRRTPSVILVSLIDVLLVVLIFLMISTTFKKAQPALKLTLPDSKQAATGAAEVQPFIVSVSTNFPYFYVADKPVTLDRLQTDLVAAARLNPQLKLKIRADKVSPWGEVVKVIDAGLAAKVAIDVLTEKPAAR